MRDRWVSLYLVVVLLQVPLYFLYGYAPLSFDFAAKEAETALRDKVVFNQAEEKEEIERAIQRAEDLLDQSGDQSSRRARIELSRGLLAWKSGNSKAGVEGLEKCRQEFVRTHGPDSFHVAALDLRIAELLIFQGQYPEAVMRFRRASPTVRQYLGPRDPFCVRMAYREVAALVSLGREGEAAELATQNLAHLKREIRSQDQQFVALTGGNLDLLHRKALFPKPPAELGTWKAYLHSLQESGQGLRKSRGESES